MKRLYNYPLMLILSVVLIPVLLVFEIAAFVQFSVFDENIYLEAVSRARVSDIIYDDLVDYFTGFSGPTGIPSEVFTEKLTKEALDDACHELLVDSFNYLTNEAAAAPVVNFDFSPIEQNVENYIRAYADSQGQELDENYLQIIMTTHNTIEAQISSRLDAMYFYAISKTAYGKFLHKYSSYVYKITLVSGIALAVLLFVMVIIDRKHPRDLPYWFGTVLFSSAVILLLPALYLDHIDYFDSFFVRREHVYKSVTGVFKVFLNRVINGQIAMLIVGLALILLTIVIHKLYIKILKEKHRHSNHF